MSDINAETFAKVSMITEAAMKQTSLLIVNKAAELGVDKWDAVRVLTFSALEFSLKANLLSGAASDLDAFRAMIDGLIDTLVTRDEDVIEAIKGINKTKKERAA